MNPSGITILGLGPGDPNLLSQQAWQLINAIDEIYLRTRYHPVVREFPNKLHSISFDDLFLDLTTYQDLHLQLRDKIIDLGNRPQGVVYAVPGNPMIGDRTCFEISQKAEREHIPLHFIGGISPVDKIVSTLKINPISQLSILDALEFTTLHVLPFPASTNVIILHVSSQVLLEQIKQALLSIFPENQMIKRITPQGENSMEVETLSLDQLDRSRPPSPLTSLFIPALGKEYAFEYFQEIIAHLRAPDGCPWDREQTHSSLRPHLLEESYELLSAIDAQDKQGMQEEFGDLLLQIVLHAQIASETGAFKMSDILHGIHTKIVRRHPHVFGDLKLADTKVVLLNWEKLKKREREDNGKPEASLLDGVALSLPSLIQADQYQKRAARVGFDWPDLKGVLDKLEEELQEVNAANDDENRGHEIGDLLFAVVNLARWYKIDPESALRATNEKFRQRFSYIEQAARLIGHSVEELSLVDMEHLWQEAKQKGNSLTS